MKKEYKNDLPLRMLFCKKKKKTFSFTGMYRVLINKNTSLSNYHLNYNNRVNLQLQILCIYDHIQEQCLISSIFVRQNENA